MLLNRIIPVLLVQNQGLYKTMEFKKPKYVGDPINTIKIFNDKEVDELILLDIGASKSKKAPDFQLIEDVASECFMPLSYGGGITNMEQVKRVFGLGIEKISLNKCCLNDLSLVEEASKYFGSQSIVVSVDVKKSLFGRYMIYDHVSKKTLKLDLNSHIQAIQEAGAGELLVTSVDQEGKMLGYDIDLYQKLKDLIKVPLIANGGAGSVDDFVEINKQTQISGMAAGSMFVFKGKHRAVLINYPKHESLRLAFANE